MVEESKPEFHRLKRNPYYWKVDTAGNQLPYVDEVTLAMYSDPEVLSLKSIQGEFDIFGQNADLANFPVYKKNQDKAGYNMMIWKTTNANFMGFQFNLISIQFNCNAKGLLWGVMVGMGQKDA